MFGSNFNSFYGDLKNRAQGGDTQADLTLGGLGASGYGAENDQTRRLAYSTFLGRSGYDPVGRALRFLLGQENVVGRLYDAESVANPSLRLPDFLAAFDPDSYLRAQPSSLVGRLNGYRRVHTNT